MWFMNWIIKGLNSISDWFYELYLDCYYAGWPLSNIASWFYYLCTTFNDLAWDFYDFSDWVDDVADKVANILNWSTIQSYILSWFRYLYNISDIFYYFWQNVTNVVTSWWSSVQYTVQGWITAATQGFYDLKVAWDNFWRYTWPSWLSYLDSLKSAWDNFWRYTFPYLVSFSWLTTWWNERVYDVQGLINSAFTLRDSLWAGWQEIRDKVFTFFTDPVGFIWEQFTDWFLGPEV